MKEGSRFKMVRRASAGGPLLRDSCDPAPLPSSQMAHTQLNADSSRSHTVFVISVYAISGGAGGTTAAADVVNRMTGQPAEGCSLWSRVSVVDLAGSERAARTGIEGERLKEAASINNSLMVLMKCFDVMRENAGVRRACCSGCGADSVPMLLCRCRSRRAAATSCPSERAS